MTARHDATCVHLADHMGLIQASQRVRSKLEILLRDVDDLKHAANHAQPATVEALLDQLQTKLNNQVAALTTAIDTAS